MLPTLSDGLLRTALELMRPSFVQAAALCLRDTGSGPEVVLIQTLTRKLWIIPKGWPMPGKTLAEAAATEAWEEAGIRGHVHPEPIGAFTYTKIKKSGLPVQCRPQVFRIDVTEVLNRYPEANKRTRRWVKLQEAADIVQTPGLASLLRRL
ncbi:MAG: NUDIX domain-containing protein [Rhodobacteraceae bacterium]|nr:MAG: NUDIX domain-containing protein [Paracoccaceae bacterium]